ncbi:MAG: thiamine-phosphate kinase [Pyrinomonadaceae bacterium]
MSIKSFAKSEFGFVENLRSLSSTSKIGDDCAVLPKDSKTDLVITADLLVEEIDFRLNWTKPECIGHKTLAVSLSDVAAMGAKPVWAMLSIGIPAKIWETDFVKKFYEGWFRLAKKFNVELVGGDVSKTPDKIVVDSIVAGEVKKGNAVLRSGAKAGDLIFVTGNLGGAAAGLKLLKNGERFGNSNNKNLLLRQLAPNPQTQIGQSIGAKNLATAMIDLSDGLSSDLAHICRASKTGAKIYADKIPINKNLKKFLTQKRENAKSPAENNFSLSSYLSLFLPYALNGGEDFELLFTVDPKKKFLTAKQLKDQPFSLIGEVTANTEIIELMAGKKSEILKPKGFRHF